MLLVRLTWMHRRLLRVQHVPLVSTLALHHRHALYVQVALLTSTPIHPHHVPRAMRGRLQLVVAQSVLLVLLVRLTWMHRRLLLAKFVLAAHNLLRVPSRVTLVLSGRLTSTATPPRRAKIALRDIIQRRRLSSVRHAQQVKQT